jgi:toxin ParE1/3/4
MAEIVWSASAQSALCAIADYIALDNPFAARAFVKKILNRVEHLESFPRSGSRIPEWPSLSHRQLVIRPYRVFYQIDGERVRILYIMRGEQLFHPGLPA